MDNNSDNINRKLHWSIYNPIPMELIKTVAETVRKAPLKSIKSKDGMVVYFPGNMGKKGEGSEKIRERS